MDSQSWTRQNTEIKLYRVIAPASAQPQSWNGTKIPHLLNGFWSGEKWERGKNPTTGPRFEISFLLRQSAKLGSFFALEDWKHITKKLLHHFWLYQIPRSTKNKGTGSSRNKILWSHFIKGVFISKTREKKYNLGTRKSLIYSHKLDKLLPVQKKSQMDGCTIMSIDVILLESGGKGQIRVSNFLRGKSSWWLHMGSLSLVN